MESLPFLFVVLLVLCLMPSAMSLQCLECTNSPGYTGVTKCDSDNVGKKSCDALSDRCMTMRYNFSLGGLATLDILTKNCSSSFLCDPQFKYNWCKALEITGLVSNCTLSCCQGSLCNDPNYIPSSTEGPTGSVLGLVASFGAICSALVLTMLAGFN